MRNKKKVNFSTCKKMHEMGWYKNATWFDKNNIDNEFYDLSSDPYMPNKLSYSYSGAIYIPSVDEVITYIEDNFHIYLTVRPAIGPDGEFTFYGETNVVKTDEDGKKMVETEILHGGLDRYTVGYKLAVSVVDQLYSKKDELNI